jgi:adenylate cyclase
VNCAIEIQRAMVERNAEVAADKRIEFRIGIHLGDVVEESDGDLMGDGVNVAAPLDSVAQPGAICLSEDAYRQVKQRLDLKVSDLGLTQLKDIAEPVHVYSLEVGQPAQAKAAPPTPTESQQPCDEPGIIYITYMHLAPPGASSLGKSKLIYVPLCGLACGGVAPGAIFH